MERLHFHPAVQRDLQSAYGWYESHRVGLGSKFLDAVEVAASTIATSPTRLAAVDGDVRIASLTRFPCAIYFRIVGARIRILAVYHTSRDSLGWQIRVADGLDYDDAVGHRDRKCFDPSIR